MGFNLGFKGLTIYRDEGNRIEQVLVLIYFNLFTLAAVAA